MAVAIDIPKEELEAFCRRHRINRLMLFGSVLRDDFSSDSDIDVLVEFEPEARITLLHLVEIENELSAIFRRPVDLGEYRSVEEDPNYLRRRHILSSVETVYETG
jgi:predicted nucleotidyltransferase